MPLRDRLQKDVLRLLYEGKKKEPTVMGLAIALSVRWETVKKILDEFAKAGHVEITKTNSFPFSWVVSLTGEGKKLASDLFPAAEAKLGDVENLILLIIYAVGGEVKGTTKLEKLPFLLERECGVTVQELLNYYPYLHGPFSRDLLDGVNLLRYFGFLNVNEQVFRNEVVGDTERMIRTFTLTDRGCDLAKSIFESLRPEHQKNFIRLRTFSQMTLKELLGFVYSKYPEFKKHTKVDQI